MKKNWLFVVIVVAIGVLIYLLLQLNRLRNFEHNNSSLTAIPSNASLIIKARNIAYLQEQINEEINFKPELYSSNIIKETLKIFTIIDSFQVDENATIQDLKKHPVYISIHGQGKQSVKTLFLIELKNKKEAFRINNFIETVLATKTILKKREYNSTNIYELKDRISDKNYFICIKQGQLFISESSLLVETSLRQIASAEDWTQKESFQLVKKTAGAASNINLFINFSTLQDILIPITNKTTHTALNNISEQSEWGELDLEIKNDGLLLNGFLAGNTKGIYACLINNSKANKKDILEFLPSNSKAYISLSVDNGKDLQNRLSAYYQGQNQTDPASAFEKKHRVKFRESFFSLLSGELAITFDGNLYSNKGILILGLESQSESEATLKQLLKNTGSSSEAFRIYKPDNALSYKIYKGFQQPVFNILFGELLGDIPNNYFTFYKNNLIVADSYEQLEQFLYSNILNKTLKHNKLHKQFLNHFSSRDNLFIFGKTEYLPQTTKTFFSPLWKNLNDEQKTALSNFYSIGFQLSGTGNMTYSTTYLQYLPNKTSEPQTIWQSLLDTLAISKPSLVKNHYTNEKEIIVQDAYHNLYLMNNNGRMLWKRPLDAPIISEITQIDYYRNNKLQYAFNTKNKIYILDRNGNHVANFPVKLPSPATNGLSVIDYDNNTNYRFFIACSNNKIYLYNKKGNLMPGWTFKGCEGRVTMPVQHFRNGSKDYLVVSDDRKNYILDRRGNIRVPIKNNFVRNPNSLFFLSNNKTTNAQLISSDTKGLLKKINLKSGEVTSYDAGNIGTNHKLSIFQTGHQENYIFSEPHRITVFNNKLKTIFEKEFDKEINLNVDLYQFSSQNIKFGVTELKGNNIYLINNDGSFYKGFPLIGKSRFSIGFLKSSSVKFNLIVAGTNNYLYNYRVE